MIRRILPLFACLLAAAVIRFWLAPLAARLTANYTSETHYLQVNQFRDSPDGEWQSSELTVRRIDQALAVKDQAIMIQGDLHIYYDNGALNFETSGLYGVDRRSRENLPGYGNEKRAGQYLFPAPAAKTKYTLRDPFYIGPQTITFDHTEKVDGLSVYVFTLSVVELNETDGYGYLPIVPEQYLAHTNARGTIWVEPLSGVVVNYEDEGTSTFVDPASGEQIADFNKWTNVFTPATRTAQTALVRSACLRILALETWLPGGLLLAGLGWLGMGYLRSSKLRDPEDGGAT